MKKTENGQKHPAALKFTVFSCFTMYFMKDFNKITRVFGRK